ncbi:MAG: TonB-dependent receptor [Alphaproteobacteria bacterium]|nr:TonB-dependent receptor [Alphaproteobacteria bacterium]MCB9696067.1 TonB-dependent receptor [Alphaproteobacteria bacterium]
MIGWFVGVALAEELAVEVREKGDAGGPIASATVDLACGDGSRSATTDAEGRATLSFGTPPCTLSVTAPGFHATERTLDAPGEVVVWVRPGHGEMEIVVEGLKSTADPTRYSVDAEQAEETPGTLDDAVRLVQSLPGVTVQREYSPSSGDLSVRGSSPGDSRYFLDGIEIPYLYHYNQYASVFPATQIDTLELFPSTFSARYGDAVGAVIDARSRIDVPDGLHGSGSVNFVMASAEAKAPVGRGWWLGVSGRRSYQDLAGESTAQYTLWPIFGDWVVRAEHGSPTRGTGVFAFGASDRYERAAGELDLLDPLEATTTPYLDYAQHFEGLGVRRQWGGELGGRVSAGLVRHVRRADLSGIGDERLESDALVSRGDLGWYPTAAADRWARGLDLGWELNSRRVGYVIDDAGPDGLRVAEEAPGLGRGVSIDDELWRLQGGLYGTGHAQLGPVRVMPGLRVDGDSTIAEAQVEPRLAARWKLADQTMIKAGAGRYAQRPDSEHLFAGTGNPDLPTTTSWQVSGGWEQTVSGRLELGLEAYRKWLFDPLVFPIDDAAYAVPTGDAWGVEAITRYRIREIVFLWGWLAVQQSTVEEPDGTIVPSDGDQRVSGGVVVSVDQGGWNLGARYRYASGLPFTQLDGSLYDAGNDVWVPTPGPTNGARLPPYHKVDLRAAHTWSFRGWSLTFTTEVWIVPKASAQLYPTWNFDYTEQGWVSGPTFLPLLSLRAKF